MQTRPQSPPSFHAPMQSLRRGASRMSQSFATTFSRGQRTSPNATPTDSTLSTSLDEKQAPLHRSSSAGNMLSSALLVPTRRRASVVNQQTRPQSFHGMDALMKQTSPTEAFANLRKERLQFLSDHILAMPIEPLNEHELGRNPSKRFQKIRSLRDNCPQELEDCVPWKKLVDSCWLEVDHSFDHLFRMQDMTDSSAVARLFAQVPNLSQTEPLPANKLKDAIAEGILPIAARLRHDMSGAFEFLDEQFRLATNDTPVRPRKASTRPQGRDEVIAPLRWQVSTVDRDPVGLFVQRPGASTSRFSEMLTPFGVTSEISHVDWLEGYASEGESSPE